MKFRLRLCRILYNVLVQGQIRKAHFYQVVIGLDLNRNF